MRFCHAAARRGMPVVGGCDSWIRFISLEFAIRDVWRLRLVVSLCERLADRASRARATAQRMSLGRTPPCRPPRRALRLRRHRRHYSFCKLAAGQVIRSLLSRERSLLHRATLRKIFVHALLTHVHVTRDTHQASKLALNSITTIDLSPTHVDVWGNAVGSWLCGFATVNRHRAPAHITAGPAAIPKCLKPRDRVGSCASHASHTDRAGAAHRAASPRAEPAVTRTSSCGPRRRWRRRRRRHRR